jgi:hypothetical protein
MKQTRQPVLAVKQSFYLDVYSATIFSTVYSWSSSIGPVNSALVYFTLFLSQMSLFFNLRKPFWSICNDPFLYWRCVILSTWHFVHMAFCHFHIFLLWHFVNVTFSYLGILSTWHFVHMAFCPHDILSTWHFVHMALCPQGILSTWHFVIITFSYYGIL